MFIRDPYKNKATHTQLCQWLTTDSFLYLGPTNPTIKGFITSSSLLYRVCTREKGARHVLKAHSPFDTPCQGWATPALCTTFSHQIKKKKKKTSSLDTPHPFYGKWHWLLWKPYAQQWSPMEQQILMSFSSSAAFQVMKSLPCTIRLGCVFVNTGLLAYQLPFIW